MNQTSKDSDFTVGNENNVDTGHKRRGTTFRLLWNRLLMQRSIDHGPKSTSTVRFSTTLSCTRTRRSPILTQMRMIPSMCSACLAALCRLECSAGLTWLPTVELNRIICRIRACYRVKNACYYLSFHRAFGWMPIDIPNPYGGPGKREATSCASKVNVMSTAY